MIWYACAAVKLEQESDRGGNNLLKPEVWRGPVIEPLAQSSLASARKGEHCAHAPMVYRFVSLTWRLQA